MAFVFKVSATSCELLRVILQLFKRLVIYTTTTKHDAEAFYRCSLSPNQGEGAAVICDRGSGWVKYREVP